MSKTNLLHIRTKPLLPPDLPATFQTSPAWPPEELSPASLAPDPISSRSDLCLSALLPSCCLHRSPGLVSFAGEAPTAAPAPSTPGLPCPSPAGRRRPRPRGLHCSHCPLNADFLSCDVQVSLIHVAKQPPRPVPPKHRFKKSFPGRFISNTDDRNGWPSRNGAVFLPWYLPSSPILPSFPLPAHTENNYTFKYKRTLL